MSGEPPRGKAAVPLKEDLPTICFANRDRSLKMGKGLTLTKEELLTLKTLLEELI